MGIRDRLLALAMVRDSLMRDPKIVTDRRCLGSARPPNLATPETCPVCGKTFALAVVEAHAGFIPEHYEVRDRRPGEGDEWAGD